MSKKNWHDRWGSDSDREPCSRVFNNYPSFDAWHPIRNKPVSLYIQCSIDKQICFKLTKEFLGKLKVKMLLGVDTNIRVKGIRYRLASIKEGHVIGGYMFNGKQIKATYISNGVWKIQVK